LIEGLSDEYLKIHLKQYITLHPHTSFQELRKVVLMWAPDKYDGLACHRISTDTTQEKTTDTNIVMKEQTAEQEITMAEMIRGLTQAVSELQQFKRETETLRQTDIQQAEIIRELTQTVKELLEFKRNYENRVQTGRPREGRRRDEQRDRRCFNCGRSGHVAAACRQTKHHPQHSSSSDDDHRRETRTLQ
ncbi:hypothetical protein EGW08_023220, partial [Elysia chlorotica]